MAALNELMIDGQHYRINIAGTYDVWSEEYGDWKPWFPTHRWDQDFKARLKAARAKQLILESGLNITFQLTGVRELTESIEYCDCGECEDAKESDELAKSPTSTVELNPPTVADPTTFKYDHGLEVPLSLPLMEGSTTSFKRVGNLTLERNDGQLYRVRQDQVERLENGQWLRSHTTYVPYIRQIAQEFYPIEMWNDRPKELEGGFVRMYWRTLETVVLWGRRLKWVAVGR